MDKTRVLIAVDKMNIGGYDIVAYNLQKNLNPEKFECSYLIRGEKQGVLEQSIIDSGARVYHQPDDRLGYLKSYFYLKHFFRENHFDVVHSHLTFFSGIVMRAAYKTKVKKRISHSHFTDPCFENRSRLTTAVANVYQAIMRVWLNRYSTDIIGCGQEAGEYLFGKKNFRKKGIVLNNGIYTDQFSFDENAGSNIRKELCLDGKYVLGHVGRLNYIKNHKFIIDIFSEFLKKHPESALLIVGDGEQREAITQRAESLGIGDKVIITGIRRDVSALLSAMDCFVFPSFKEGFPLTLVEAQGTGLACLISDTVTKSARLNSNVYFLSLEDSAQKWADKAFELMGIDRRSVDLTRLKDEFDINIVARRLEEIYLD